MGNSGHRYFVINKPYNMVSQFVSSHQVALLGDLDFTFPEGIHAIGRLDNNSEGLLLLTTNKMVTRLLFSGSVLHTRSYLVQVNNTLSDEHLLQLQTGIAIRIKGGEDYVTPPCNVTIVDEVEKQYHIAPVLKLYGPHTWLLITLTEGKYHQVRKMMAAVRHRCKRLIRVAIEDIELGTLAPGAVIEMEEANFFRRLKIGAPITS